MLAKALYGVLGLNDWRHATREHKISIIWGYVSMVPAVDPMRQDWRKIRLDRQTRGGIDRGRPAAARSRLT